MDNESGEFRLSEFVLEKMESEHISVRSLAQKAGVSPTVIQKIRSGDAERINFRTLTGVLNSLGYRITIEKMQGPDSAGTVGDSWADFWEYLDNFIDKKKQV